MRKQKDMLQEGVKITKKDIENMDLNALRIGFEFEILFLFPLIEEAGLNEYFVEHIKDNFEEEDIEEKIGDPDDLHSMSWEEIIETFEISKEEAEDLLYYFYEENLHHYEDAFEFLSLLENYFSEKLGISELTVTKDLSVLEDKNEIVEFLLNNKIPFPGEVITPPLQFHDSMKILDKMLNLIKEKDHVIDLMNVEFITTKTSGLHVNISVDPKSEKFKELNKMYALLLSSFDFLVDIFDEEEERRFYIEKMGEVTNKFLEYIIREYNSDYVEENTKILADFLRKLIENQQSLGLNIERKLKNFMNEKYRAVNLGKPDYVEFRVIGGKNYEEKRDEIIKNIVRFAFVVWESSTKNYSKLDEIIKRTAKKLFKFMSEVGKSTRATSLMGTFTKVKVKEQDLQKIRNYAKKFGNLEEEVKKALFVLRYFLYQYFAKGDEKTFVYNLKWNLEKNLTIDRSIFDKNIADEFLPKTKEATFADLYFKLKNNKKDFAKFAFAVRNIMQRNDLDMKEIVKQIMSD